MNQSLFEAYIALEPVRNQLIWTKFLIFLPKIDTYIHQSMSYMKKIWLHYKLFLLVTLKSMRLITLSRYNSNSPLWYPIQKSQTVLLLCHCSWQFMTYGQQMLVFFTTRDAMITLMQWIFRIIVPAQVGKNARWISWSKSLRGTLFKPRRRQLVLVLLYIYFIIII